MRPWERAAIALALVAAAVVVLLVVAWRDADPEGAWWLNGRALLALVLAGAGIAAVLGTRPPPR